MEKTMCVLGKEIVLSHVTYVDEINYFREKNSNHPSGVYGSSFRIGLTSVSELKFVSTANDIHNAGEIARCLTIISSIRQKLIDNINLLQ